MQNVRTRLRLCVLANALQLAVVVAVICAFANRDELGASYLRFGPHEDLIVLGVRIDSAARYLTLIALLAVLQVVDVVASEIGNPILAFSIYNPEKRVIDQFTRLELQTLANSMWLLASLRAVVMTVVSITQVDLALVRVVAGEGATVFTIRKLLSEKQFPLDDDDDDSRTHEHRVIESTDRSAADDDDEELELVFSKNAARAPGVAQSA